jgi:hypothetical protein
MNYGVHGEKLVSALANEKLPESDKTRLEKAIQAYHQWQKSINEIVADDITELVEELLKELNRYKSYIDIDLIFDSPNDFLYRQKGQLKLDNTVIEEFLPVLVKRCIEMKSYDCKWSIAPQTATYSSVYFNTNLNNPAIGGGMTIKTKDQDFALTRKLYIRSSYCEDFSPDETVTFATNLGFILAETKTNLDKTMFQEASATARDVKLAVTGAKYFLLCDYLDMTPISSATTDIDEVLILRKAKRINSNVRAKFSTYQGRQNSREGYINYLKQYPYSTDVFHRFVDHVLALLSNETLVEEDVLNLGHF